MNIKTFFQKSVETRDDHSEKMLKTKYFNFSYERMKKAFLQIADEKEYVVKNFNDRYKEAYIEHHNHYIITTFTPVNPLETAVNFKVGMYTLFGRNRPRLIVSQWFGALAKQLRGGRGA